MKISEKTWVEYITKLSRLNETAGRKMAEYIEKHGTADTDKLIAYAQALVQKYGEGSAELACQMYDAVAKDSGKSFSPAEPATPASYRETAGMVRDTQQSPLLLQNGVSRLVKRVASDTTLKNAIRDGAEWAWVPHGDSCAFCRVLASRGWEPASRKALKGGHAQHIHANCDCEYAIRFDSRTSVAGYDPDKYLREYEKAGGDINAMRREHYAQHRDEINAQKRAAYAARVAKKAQPIINGKQQKIPMDIQNALKANPHYSAGKQYQVNCQRCVQAYELRRRGYDVEALSKLFQNDIIIWGNECFVDANGNIPQFAYFQTKSNIQTELSNAPNGARYIIYAQWQGNPRTAHVFIAEKSNGAIHYIDPQTADSDVSRYLNLGIDGQFGLLRIDDKQITSDTNLINATVR